MIENQPVEPAVAVKSKSFRTLFQVPLLLAAAAGLGFAGQQVWQNQGDVSKIFHNSQGEFQCPIAAMFGCGSKSSCASIGCNSSANAAACASAMIEASLNAEGCTANDDCCAAMLRAAEAAANEAPVSALTPVNADGLL